MEETSSGATFTTPKPSRSHLLRRLAQTTPAGVESPAVRIPATPFLRKLGFGTGVSVFLYERSPTQTGVMRSPWAVKKINQKNGPEPDVIRERLEREANILKTLAHPNIIGFRAFKPTESGSCCLVMEDGQKSLLDCIEERKDRLNQPFPADNIEKVIRCIAEALNYLHTEKQLMHGDLKSANVLIGGNFEGVKLCDFGVTLPVNCEGRVCDPNCPYVGTEAWSALEVIMEKEVTTKADIFAFGLVIFEMLALHPPHIDKLFLDDTETDASDDGQSDDSGDNSDDSLDDTEFRAALGTRPPLPAHIELDTTYKKVLEIFFATTHEDPNLRPSAKEILHILDAKGEEGDDSILCVNMVKDFHKNLAESGDTSVVVLDQAPPAL